MSDKTPRQRSPRIPVLVQLALGVLVGMLLPVVPSDVGMPPLFVLLTAIGLVFASMILHIVLHEGGHLLGGLCSGYRFVSFRIGSCMWYRAANSGIGFTRQAIPGLGGQCLMDPPDPDARGEFPYTLYVLSGSAANLVAAMLVSFLLLISMPWPLRLSLGFFIGTGVILGLVNLLPLTHPQVDTDGNIYRAARASSLARVCLWRLFRLNALFMRGARPEEIDAGFFYALPADADLANPLIAAITIADIDDKIVKDDFDGAAVQAKRLLTQPGLSEFQINKVHSALLYVELLGAARSDEIAALYTEPLECWLKGLRGDVGALTLRYAGEMLCRRDEAAAQELLRAFERVAKTCPCTGIVQYEREQLTRIAACAASRFDSSVVAPKAVEAR